MVYFTQQIYLILSESIEKPAITRGIFELL